MSQEIEEGDLVEWHALCGIKRGRVKKAWATGHVTVVYTPDLTRPDEVEEFTLTPGGARRQLTVYEKGKPRVRKG